MGRARRGSRDRVKVIDAVVLRGGVEIENPLETALEFVEAYSAYDSHDSRAPHTFDESDLRLANRGGARISATEIAAILERRGRIERALRKVQPDASLSEATSSIPWIPLTQLFEAFAGIRGVGFSKMTKALHGVRAGSPPPAPPGRRSDRRSGRTSGLHHDLDRLAVVHRTVAVRYLVEADDPVEDAARLDPAFEDVWEKLLDVRADRGGAAAHAD